MSPGPLLACETAPLASDNALPNWWKTLYDEDENASIFMSPEWVSAWLDVYGQGITGQWIRWSANGKTVGGCLIVERTTWRGIVPMRSVHINLPEEVGTRSPATEYNSVMALPGFESSIAHQLVELLAKRRWTRLLFEGHTGTAMDLAILAQLPTTRIVNEGKPSPYVDLLAIEGGDYDATLSSRTRSQLRRCRRQYAEQYGSVTLSVASSLEEMQQYLRELGVLHNAIWTSRGLLGAFADDSFNAFHERIVERLWPQGAVELLKVQVGDRVIGYLYNFIQRNKVFCYQSGFVQEEDPHLKAGMLTHATAISHYCARGLREYDFLAGEARYKRHLTKVDRTIYWSTAYRASFYSRVLLAGRSVRDHLREKRLKAGTPAGTEQMAKDDA